MTGPVQVLGHYDGGCVPATDTVCVCLCLAFTYIQLEDGVRVGLTHYGAMTKL